MKLISRRIVFAAAVIGSLTIPFALQAAVTPVAATYTQAQQDAALSQVTRALKAAGAPGIQNASPKQLGAAVASVAVANKANKMFVGTLAYALIKARPEMTVRIAKMLVEDLTRPGECPDREFIHQIAWAVAAANQPAAPELVRELIAEYPCRAGAIAAGALAAVPASESRAVFIAAYSAAPEGDRVAVVDAARQAGADTDIVPINPALVHPPLILGSSNNSAATINPVNISGDGSTVPVIQTNSQDSTTGG